ncbi:hypothetical protein [Streptomyces sp. TRM68367]|uniref:hypothetical protein n=1 Tax=Streptomyces sp. TRM68367 TaxID=2758415 RepID=UPI00293428D1|nr:hypothetical protein [Streptomyces sp. TRM68367]
MTQRAQALFAMTAENVPQVFPPDVLARLRESVDLAPALVAEDLTDPRVLEALGRTEILITGWGCPRLDVAALDAAPKLRAVLHSAGSVKSFATPELRRRGIAVSSAATANALPVAEYTLAMILLAGRTSSPPATGCAPSAPRPAGASSPASATTAAASASSAPPASAAGSWNCCAPST